MEETKNWRAQCKGQVLYWAHMFSMVLTITELGSKNAQNSSKRYHQALVKAADEGFLTPQ